MAEEKTTEEDPREEALEEVAEEPLEEVTEAPTDPALSDEAGIPSDEVTVASGVRAAETRGQHRRKIRVGVVVKDVQDKTVTVEVQRQFAHELYGKQVGRSRRYHAHDEENEYQRGDVVQIVETRPLSKTKRWRVDDLVERPE